MAAYTAGRAEQNRKEAAAMHEIKIAPSLLAADFSRLAEEVRAVRDGGADMLHLDVMDGVFVPNISLGMPVIASLRGVSDLFFDVHIMITEPQRHIEALAAAGADCITFHVEAARDPAALIRQVHALGLRAGITLRPGTPVSAILPFLDQVELALVMTVEPGFGGQKFMPDMLPKVRTIRERADALGRDDLIVQVDGGVGAGNAALCAESGANCLVAGSAVFGKPDYGTAIRAIRAAVR